MTTPCGYQQIVAATLDTGAALTIPPITAPASQRPSYVLLIAEGQAVRWRDDGTAPTATVGMLLPTNMPTRYDGDLSRVRFISATAGAILNVNYYY